MLTSSNFLSVWRTISWLIEGTISGSTTWSANGRRLQLAKPVGGGRKRVAMTFASCSPLSSLERGGCSRTLPFTVMSNPNVTSRSRGFSTVWVRQPTASAILASVHAVSSTSAFSRISARRTFWEEPLRYLTTSVSVARSTSVRRTIYFFRMAEPSVVTAIMS